MNTAPKVQVRRLMQQAEKYKNERHHTYATFLFRDVRQVSRLTGKSNVTKEVHESDVRHKKKDDWAQIPHFSEAVKQEVSLHDMVCTVLIHH